MITAEQAVDLVAAALDEGYAEANDGRGLGVDEWRPAAVERVKAALENPDGNAALGEAMAVAVVSGLRTQAEDPPDPRKGARWATELARAAATIEQAYGLGDDTQAPDSELHDLLLTLLDGATMSDTLRARVERTLGR